MLIDNSEYMNILTSVYEFIRRLSVLIQYNDTFGIKKVSSFNSSFIV